jgi:hypothetical protein
MSATEPSPPPVFCPHADAIAPVGAAEITLDDLDHKHATVGPLLFCFRCGAKGWIFAGAVVASLGHVVSAATWAESFRVARDAMTRHLGGLRPEPKLARCPECEQIFPEAPAGKAPHEWLCGPEHYVTSVDGATTRYAPGEPTTVTER